MSVSTTMSDENFTKARKRASAARNASSASMRSVSSRATVTRPWTSGSSRRLVTTLWNNRVEKSAMGRPTASSDVQPRCLVRDGLTYVMIPAASITDTTSETCSTKEPRRSNGMVVPPAATGRRGDELDTKGGSRIGRRPPMGEAPTAEAARDPADATVWQPDRRCGTR